MEPIGIIAVIIVAWFAAGTIWNVHKGREVMRWLQQGLPQLGARTTVRWLGSSVVELVIQNPVAPFSAITLIVFLRARDLPWGWFGRRRDALIVRAMLNSAPTQECEVLDESTWSGHEARSRIPQAWRKRDDAKLTIYHAHPAAPPHLNQMLTRLRQSGYVLHRLSLRAAAPHFQIHIAMPNVEVPTKSSRELAGLMRDVAQHMA
ncbi:MAG: hypothetical protein ING75_01670 [Rhodocyclaceae bacterium]|nr:hypothetical protein [Rhodocyclaceae bacterium]